MSYRRYAIYAIPAPGSELGAFCAAWLGWDPATGTAVPHPDIPGLPAPIADLTATPRRYGFHGTLKPPFRLADGKQFEDLAGAFDTFASTAKPVVLDGLRVARLGRFVALIPVRPSEPLNTLAARIVETFEPFRAPLTEAETERRKPELLTSRQRDFLDRWGYPYVMEEFRFHMTLTGSQSAEHADTIAGILSAHLATLLAARFRLAHVAVFGEATDGRFHMIRHATLSG